MTLAPLLQRWVEAVAHSLLQSPDAPIDFAYPAGEEALVPPNSISWRIFKNPVALFVGGVAAVILELAEPRVRTGVWEHTSFRTDPLRRLQRTGLAAMVTVYGPRSVAERMIAGVVCAHSAIAGHTPAGQPYRANDVELLSWVQATACYGFAQAYSRYVRPLTRAEFDEALFTAVRPQLEPSPILAEFLQIMRDVPVFPGPPAPRATPARPRRS